jgi:drug/metabolite transporter (DMT)-like permease
MTDIASRTGAGASVLRGILLMVLSVLLFSSMDAVIKWASSDYPTGQIVFFRNFLAFVPVFLFLWNTGTPMPLRTTRLVGHLVRGLVGVASMSLFFLALGLLPLADTMALGMSGPIFLTALSVPLLGERVGLRRWSAVIVGFIGVLVMLAPHFDLAQHTAMAASTVGIIFAIIAAFCSAGSVIQTRRLTQTRPPPRSCSISRSSARSPGTWPFGWLEPSWIELAALVTVGLFGGLAHILLTESYRLAPASLVAPFDYTSMLWAFVLGYVFFRELPTVYVFVGGAIIAAAGLFVIWRERQLGLQRMRAAEGPPTGT